MEKIKFQAWDKKNNVMLTDVVGIYFFPGCISVTIQDEGGFTEVDDVILRLSTGLHDKNGKEIFEGDFIKCGDTIYEIVFEQGEYHTGFKKKSGDYLTDLGKEFANRFEIIGNIYETSKLVE